MNARNTNKLISPTTGPSPKGRSSLHFPASSMRHAGTEHERSHSITGSIGTSSLISSVQSDGASSSLHNSPNNNNQSTDSDTNKVSMEAEIGNKVRRSSLSDAEEAFSRTNNIDESEADKPVRRTTSDLASPRMNNLLKKNFHTDVHVTGHEKNVFSFIQNDTGEGVVSSSTVTGGMKTPSDKDGNDSKVEDGTGGSFTTPSSLSSMDQNSVGTITPGQDASRRSANNKASNVTIMQ